MKAVIKYVLVCALLLAARAVQGNALQVDYLGQVPMNIVPDGQSVAYLLTNINVDDGSSEESDGISTGIGIYVDGARVDADSGEFTSSGCSVDGSFPWAWACGSLNSTGSFEGRSFTWLNPSPGESVVSFEGYCQEWPVPSTGTRFCDVNGGSWGSEVASVSTIVIGMEPTVSLSTFDTLVLPGRPATLTWSSTDADTCTGSWTGAALGTSGSDVVAVGSTTTYTMTCNNAVGDASDSVTVTVFAGINGLISEDSAYGVDTITHDTHTGLRWLDVTLSTPYSYDGILPELKPGGAFHGYRLATLEEVLTFWQNAGINTGPGFLQAFTPENFQPVVELMAYVSVTGHNGNLGGGNVFDYTAGHIESGSGGGGRVTVASIASDPDPTVTGRPGYGTVPSDNSNTQHGSWLVKNDRPLAVIETVPDINSNGVDDIAVVREGSVFAQVPAGSAAMSGYVRDASTDALLGSHAFDATRNLLDAGVVDIDGSPALAVLGMDANGRAWVEVRDAVTGNLVGDVWFSIGYQPVALAVLPDLNGNNTSEVAVLMTRPSDGNRAWVHIKDASTLAYVKNVWYELGYTPHDIEYVPNVDANPGPELAVLMTRDSDNDRAWVHVKDARTGSFVRNIWFQSGYTPKDLAIIDNLDGNPGSEVAVLMIRNSDNRPWVHLKDAKTGAFVRNVWFSAGFTPLALAIVPNLDANSGDELAMLVSRDSDERAWVHLKDAGTGTFIKNVWFQADFLPRDIAVLPNMDGNPGSELAVLGVKSGGQVQTEIKDAKTGAFVNQVNFP